MTKQANPLIWGAVAAIIAAGMVSIALFTGEDATTKPLLDHPGITIGAAFFWGWALGHAKNRYGKAH